MEIKRGYVYLIDFNPSKSEDINKTGAEIQKTRPAVVLSNSTLARIRQTVVVVPLSTSPAPAEIFAVPIPSMGENSVAVCDQVTTINKKTRILRELAKLTQDELKKIERCVRDALDLF